MGGWLTDFETDVYVLGGIGQTITSPFYSLGNEMSPAYGCLPYLRDNFIVTEGFEPKIRAEPRATEQLILLLALHGFY